MEEEKQEISSENEPTTSTTTLPVPTQSAPVNCPAAALPPPSKKQKIMDSYTNKKNYLYQN